MSRSNKTAFVLAWNFFKGNYALNFAVVAILIVLNILGMIPIIGMLFVLGYSILEFSIQIFFGRKVAEIKSEEEMQLIAANTRIGDLLTNYLPQAAGAFLAFFLMALVFMALFGMIVSATTGFQAVGSPDMAEVMMDQMIFAVGGPSLIFLLIIGILFYFYPAVMGKVFKSDDFVGAFKSSFLLFSPTLWKSTFNKDYFLLVFLWSIIVTIAVIVIVLMMGTIILIPVGLILAYLLSLYNAAIYVFAEELAK